MAHYVVADIHGEADRFYTMLEKIQFSDADTMYILGDVVDRGPDGIKLLQDIMKRTNMVMLLGNHEYMMLQYFSPDATSEQIRRWNRNGNGSTSMKNWLPQVVLRNSSTIIAQIHVNPRTRRASKVSTKDIVNVHYRCQL